MCLVPNENLKNKTFESLKYNISDATENIFLDNSCDPDANYFNTDTKNFNTPYVIPEEFHSQFKKHICDGLLFFHIKIKSINKNFENFKALWDMALMEQQSLINLYMNYQTIQVFIKWESKKRGEESHSISTDRYSDLSINSDDVESISVELLFKNRKITIFNVLYRQPKGQMEPFEKFLKEKFSRIKRLSKQFHVAGDLNLNVLDYEICKKVQQFLNIIYESGMIPIINKPTGVANKTATVIDVNLTNSNTERSFKTAILRCFRSFSYLSYITISKTFIEE